MNRFISTISIVSIATVAGLAVAPKTLAQTVNSGEVQMTATINSFCLFENQMNGTLGVSPGNLRILDSTEGANGITTEPGTFGSIDVTCNDSNMTINIDSVTETNTANATVQSYTATVSGESMQESITSENGGAGTAVAIGSTQTETLEVDLSATYRDNLTAGDYTYTVNLVANP